MSYEMRANPVFEADLRDVLKHFPAAKKDIEQALKSLQMNPKQGDFYAKTYPELYKSRVGLKSYNIGARGGLRIVCAVSDQKRVVLPITIWQKKTYTEERHAVAHTKARYEATIAALEALAAEKKKQEAKQRDK